MTPLAWIDGGAPGRLAISPRPRGADWLEAEVDSWRRHAVDVIVSLLTQEEEKDLELTLEESVCKHYRIRFERFPIPDRGVPESTDAAALFFRRLAELLNDGRTIAIHCRQGIGRAALVAAGVLILRGMTPNAALERITAARGLRVPETVEQRLWIETFARAANATKQPA
jgi:protein-tyrosine phosphatase